MDSAATSRRFLYDVTKSCVRDWRRQETLTSDSSGASVVAVCAIRRKVQRRELWSYFKRFLLIYNEFHGLPLSSNQFGGTYCTFKTQLAHAKFDCSWPPMIRQCRQTNVVTMIMTLLKKVPRLSKLIRTLPPGGASQTRCSLGA